MANIKLNRKEIEKHFKLNAQNLERINMFGIQTKLSEDFLEAEITANRPDLLSLQGFVRAVKAFLDKERGLKRYKIHEPEKNFRVRIESAVNTIRPYTTCAIVKNLKFNDENIKELVDIQEKIHTTLGRNRKKAAIGIYPLEKIKLPIIYTAKKPSDIKFIPLESNKEMNALEILQKHPTGREYAHLLEGLDKFPVFLDSTENILSLPPIINSHETGKITHETKEVFIECSGSSLDILNKILNIIVTAFADMGGKVYAMELDYEKEKKIITPDLNPEKIKISLENVNSLLGLQLKEKDIENLLPRMGYDYSKPWVKIPAWRVDILHEVDIIEDIAIAYGYDNLIAEIPRVSTIGEETKENKIQNKIAEILSGLGLLEISSYHLIKEEEARLFKIQDKIEVENSKTEYKILRSNLLIPALRIFAENKDNEYPQRIFEIGSVFSKDTRKTLETGIIESNNLLIACSPGNFTELKQILDYLIKSLSIDYQIKESKTQGLIEGRTGSVLFNNKNIGYIGELHPNTLKDFNIKQPVTFIEISLSEFFKDLK